jgi:hypothetical protein
MPDYPIISIPAGQTVIIENAGTGARKTVYAGRTGSFQIQSATSWRPAQPDRSIARVRLGPVDRTFCYKNPDGAVAGDTVRVVLPDGSPHYARVVGNGRGSYTGPVYKTCELAQVS